MQIKTYNVYKFDELTDEQKEKAIEHYSDINIDHDWWQFYQDDSAIELKELDLYRREIKIDFAKSAVDTAAYIVKNHGEMCATHTTSAAFLKKDNELVKQWDELKKEYNETTDDEKSAEIIEKQDDIERQREDLAIEYRDELAQDVLVNLQNEYEYLTSEEAIIGTLRLNDYDFTEDGRID